MNETPQTQNPDAVQRPTPRPDLETRVCVCGCGNEFRCLPTSDQQYANSRHDPNFDPRESEKRRTGQIRALRWQAKERGKKIIKDVEERQAAPPPAPLPEPVELPPPPVTLKKPEPEIEEPEMSQDTTGLLNNREMAIELGVSNATFSKYVSKEIVKTRIEGRQRWDPEKTRKQVARHYPDEAAEKPAPAKTRLPAVVNPDDDTPEAVRFSAKRDYLKTMVGHAQQAKDAGDHEREAEFLWIVVKDAGLLNGDK
jgi:hypothetical protein